MSYVASAVAGRILAYSASNSPFSYSTIKGVSGLAYGNATKQDINVTAMSDEDEVFIAGRRQSAEISFNLYVDYDEAAHAALLANFDANGQTLMYFRDTLDAIGAAAKTFAAYVKQWQDSADVDGANMAAVVLKVSGGVVTTP